MKRKNKLLLPVIFALLAASSLTSCSSKETLLFLNWGEYINEEIVENFEKEYNCVVKLSLADSNEQFYSKVKSGTTKYDLVCPSDYMVKKMYDQGLLQEIQFDKLSNYSDDIFCNNIYAIYDSLASETLDGQANDNYFPEYSRYQMPYFWGTFGLMYNKNKEGLEETMKKAQEDGNEWQVYFEPDRLPEGTKAGMYNVPRDAFGAAMLYKGISPNAATSENLKICKQVLGQRKWSEWGTDTLKKGVKKGDLDIAYMYTGDFLDMLFTDLDEGKTIDEITYDIAIPKNTHAFIDSLVIPKASRHVELAHKFINYMLKPENQVLNAEVVGYCVPLKEAYRRITEEYDTSSNYEAGRAYAYLKYYPLSDDSWGDKQYTGTVYSYFSKSYLMDVSTIVNEVKTK